MSDHSATPARPVSLFTLLVILAVFAAFLVTVRYFYKPNTTTAFNAQAENLPKELAWRATPEARRKALAELREKEAAEVAGYGWVDRQAGVVRLPLDRAMELTAQKYRASK